MLGMSKLELLREYIYIYIYISDHFLRLRAVKKRESNIVYNTINSSVNFRCLNCRESNIV